MRKSILSAIIFFGFLISLSGCSPVVSHDQPQQFGQVLLQDGDKAGQSFVAKHDGLMAVGVYIDPGSDSRGVLNFRLTTPSDQPVLSEKVSIPLDQIKTPGYYNFYFSPITNSSWQPYRFTLEFEGRGEVAAGAAAGDSYLQGSQYQAGAPVDGQLTFQLVYSRRWLISGFSGELMGWIGWLFAGLLLFILPGWGVLGLLHPGWTGLSRLEKTALSAGASLVIYPLITLWTHLIGWQLGAWLAWLAVGFGLIMLGMRALAYFRSEQRPRKLMPSFTWPDLALIVVLAAILISRMWVIRDLPAGMWGDSVQHTYVTQLFVDNRGLFDSWLPYAPLQSFTYHFGFHSLAAAFHWLTGLPVVQAVPVVGGLLNVLAVLVLFPFTIRLSRSPWAGVFTLLLAGLLFQMPMDYANWGRYTQSAGMVILAAAVIVAWDYFQQSNRSWKFLAICWLLFSGLALTHYRVLIFGLLFLPAFILLRSRQYGFWRLILRTLWIGLGAATLVIPWMIMVMSGKLDAITLQQLSRPASQLTEAIKTTVGFGDVFTYLPAWAWPLLPVFMAWGFWRRNLEAALINLWWFLILLAANPQWLNLPGAGIITSFAVMIVVYFPASILFGAGIGWMLESLPVKWHEINIHKRSQESPGRWHWRPAILGLLVVGIAFASFRPIVETVDQQNHMLVTWPDMAAFDWIRENIPAQANFLVNSFFAYGGSLLVGSDSGWWLSLLGDRSSSLPPLTYGSEQGPRPDYILWVNELTQLIQGKGIADPDVLAELRDRNITHVFVGQRQGVVNTPESLLDLESLLNSSAFRPVYHQDRVWIFELIPE